MRQRNPSLLAYLLLLAVVLIWGATFVLVKDALTDASPLLFNLLRMTVGAAALFLLNHREMRDLPHRTLASGLLAGFFLALGYQFQTSGLARTTPAKSAFITGMVVVFVPLLTAIPIFRPSTSRRLKWTDLFGASLAFSGLLLLTTPTGTKAADLLGSMGLGDALTLLCAIAFAAHLLTLAHTAPQIPIRQLATLQIAAAALFMLITLPLGRPLYLHATPRLILALAITGLLATAAAFTIQSWAQKHLPASHTAILLTLEPVFAWLTSFLVVHERLSHRSLTGAALIFIAIAVIELLPPTPVPIT